MPKFYIKIFLKSFESSTLQAAKEKIEQLCSVLLVQMEKHESLRTSARKARNYTFLSYVPLPSRKKKFTLLRSPHIDKKSREQFELHTYRGQIRVFSCNRKVLSVLLCLLKNSEFPGIELTVATNSLTPFYC